MLVLLRVSIGWHFYREGVKKYRDGDFSSEGFLRQAKGPLAESYKAMLPDDYGFDGYLEELLEFKDGDNLDIRLKLKPPEPKKGEPEGLVFKTPLHLWADQVAQGWGKYRSDAEKRYGYDENQKEQSQQMFDRRRKALDDTVQAAIAWLNDNPDEISYYIKLRRRAQGQDTPFSRSRLAKQTGKITAVTRELPAEAKKLERQFQADLWSLVLTADQRAKGPMDIKPTTLERFDTMMIYSHMAIGVCLMIGLFSRLAAAGGAFFLLSVVASQPLTRLFEISVTKPMAPGTDPIYLLVEALALLALATTAVGRWAGLDFFLHKLCGGCCGSKGTNDAS